MVACLRQEKEALQQEVDDVIELHDEAQLQHAEQVAALNAKLQTAETCALCAPFLASSGHACFCIRNVFAFD